MADLDMVQPSPREEAVPLAIFDLDGTLVRGDTFLPFLVSYSWRRRRFWPLVTLPLYLTLYVCRILPDWRAKQCLLVSFLRGESLATLAEHAERFCAGWVQHRLRAEVMARLREHRQAGHRIILLSASPDVYVPAIGKFLGVEEVICTRVSTGSGRCDGLLVGANCKGTHKIELLKQHLQAEEPPTQSHAYGDSRSDLPLLRWVSRGWLVQRTRLVSVSR